MILQYDPPTKERHEQLISKLRTTRSLTQSEYLEYCHLNELQQLADVQAKGRRDAENSLETQQLRQDREQLVANYKQAQLEGLALQLFRATFRINGQDKVLIDCTATRNGLISLVNPGELLPNDLVSWLTKILRDSPEVSERLVWADPPPSRKEQQKLDRQQLAEDRETFRAFCRRTELCSDTEANFNLIHSTLGAGLSNLNLSVVQMPHGPVLLTDDGEESQLSPPSVGERQQWAQERFEADQENLKQMAARGDVQGLRDRARRDREKNIWDQAQLHFEYSLLKTYGEREQGMPELPPTWNGQPLTPEFIRKASPEVLKVMMRKHGRCQMERVLFQLPADFFNNWQTKLYQIQQELQNNFGVRR